MIATEFPDNCETYLRQHTSPEDSLLQELTRATHRHALQPRMLSGHMQGKFLEFLSKMISPSQILEIGTYTGYSAICLAKGLSPDGRLHSIDKNDELRDLAERYICQSSANDRITLHTGDALQIIPQFDNLFDLVFIDGDKREYLAYYHLVIDKVRKGGYIIADNVLWSGKVLEKPKSNDKYTIELLEFNDFVQNDSRVENLILPLRDGIMLVRVL